MKEKLNDVRDLVKGIKKVEKEKKNELENAKRNYKKTVKYVAATIGISIIALFSIMARNPKDIVTPADIPTYQEDEIKNDDGSKDDNSNKDDIDDNEVVPEDYDEGTQTKKYNPTTTIGEEEKMSHGTSIEDTLYNESTVIDGKDSFKPEVEDNSQTVEALKKAEENNINVVQGDKKDEHGNLTGDTITATEDHTSGTNVDLNYEKEDKTDKGQINVENSTPATRTEDMNQDNSKEDITSTSDDRLDELMNKTEKSIEDDGFER